MNALTKIAAVIFLLVALLLGYFAWQLATRPPSAPPTAVSLANAAPVEVATVPVVVAARAVEAGRRLEPGMLKIEQWQHAPAAAVADPAPLVGRAVRTALVEGQPVGPYVLSTGLAAHLVSGERAVTIAVDELAAAQNRIRPGDLVDVFLLMERGAEVPGSQTRLLQSRVRVLAYGRESIDGPSEPDANGGNPPPAPRNAILAVPIEKVNELLLATRLGKVQLALRPLDDVAVPDVELFLKRQPVLALQPGLTPGQQAAAREGVNLAYSGESLTQLAGPMPTPEPVARPREPRGGGRSIEVLRGSSVQNVPY